MGSGDLAPEQEARFLTRSGLLTAIRREGDEWKLILPSCSRPHLRFGLDAQINITRTTWLRSEQTKRMGDY